MKLKTLFFILIFCLFEASIPCQGFGQNLKNGVYEGMEPMKGYGAKGEKWFHSNTIRIMDAQAYLDKDPVVIKNGQKCWSASDGGFFYYKGSVIHKGGKTLLNLELDHADYALVHYKYEVDPAMAKKYPDYKKWTFEEQKKKGVLVKVKRKPIKTELHLEKNGFEFHGVHYRLAYEYHKIEKARFQGHYKVPPAKGEQYETSFLKVLATDNQGMDFCLDAEFTKYPKPGSLCDIYYHPEAVKDSSGKSKKENFLDKLVPLEK